jgi:hypothetical protein
VPAALTADFGGGGGRGHLRRSLSSYRFRVVAIKVALETSYFRVNTTCVSAAEHPLVLFPSRKVNPPTSVPAIV